MGGARRAPARRAPARRAPDVPASTSLLLLLLLLLLLCAVVWTGIKVTFAGGVLWLIGYAGYTIVTTLLPSGASANAIMRTASAKLKCDPEVRAADGRRAGG